VTSGRASTTARAVGGAVEYLAGPQVEAEFLTEAVASLRGSAEFETDPVVASECDGEHDTSTGAIHTACRCERASGAKFSCEVNGPSECCQVEIGETINVEFELAAATACADACRASEPDLLVHCRNLAGR
jgi:hypothetical protein